MSGSLFPYLSSYWVVVFKQEQDENRELINKNNNEKKW